MKVTIDIPERLIRYIEFVPEDALPEVFLQALEDKIKYKTTPVINEEESKLEEILSILDRIQQGQISVNTSPAEISAIESVEHNNTVQEKQAVIINFEAVGQDYDLADEDGDDDLFGDLMK